jgi:hypothetical protein
MPTGRPPKFDNPGDMQEIIDLYFEQLGDNIPTMAGLALELDMSSRALRNYAEKTEFLPTIKRARQKVETAWETALIRGGSGSIFWLKNNAGWKDKTEREHSGSLRIDKIERQLVEPQNSNS